MDEATKRTWDVRLGIFGPIITVAGILVGVWQFNAGEDARRKSEQAARLDQIHLEMRKDALEYRRLLRQQQLQTYNTVTTLAGQIAVAPDGPARQTATQTFEAAYWGAMVMVEDPAVQQAMRDFHDELHDEATGLTHDPDRLKVRANLLSEACRKSLESNTNAALEDK
jgi:hypothetical protein